MLCLLGLPIYVSYMLLTNNPTLFTVVPQQYPIFTMSNRGCMEVTGCQNELYRFREFPEDLNLGKVKSLKILYLIIDGQSLPQSLNTWTMLESIIIEDVRIDGKVTGAY